MAVRWAVDSDKYERGSLYKFDPEEITVNPAENGRQQDPDIEWMIADIHKRGQETPVTVRSDGGKPVLVFGYQRLRAIKAINERYPDEPRRKVVCIFKQLTEEEAFRANISENRMRNETTPVDDAHNIKRLMNVYGYSTEKIIDAFFPHLNKDVYEGLAGSFFKECEDAKRWVRERMALIGLAPTAETAVREGRVKLHTAIELNKLPHAKQAEVVAMGGWVKGKDVALAAGKPGPVKRKATAVPPIEESGEEVTARRFTPEQIKNIEAAQNRRWAKPNPPVTAVAEEEEEPEEKFELRTPESIQNLAAEMANAIRDALWHPNREKKARPELLEMADFILQAAAEASETYDFPASVLDAMEAYRKAREA